MIAVSALCGVAGAAIASTALAGYDVGRPGGDDRPPPGTPPSATGCQTTEGQREIERYLRHIDGYQSSTNDAGSPDTGCATAIKAFQRRFGIDPADGAASPTTLDVARRLAASSTPGELARCAAGQALTICVDLTQQTVWAVRGGTLVFAPTVARTGMAGLATPPGTYWIDRRNISEWSVEYREWLPFWQDFDRGIGIHETTTYLHDPSLGSHGCVNLLHVDAAALWNLTPIGTTVQVFGCRPGT